ncbi:PolC-type DNA polymerase III [Winogradskyella sp. A2]|uniref:3'-5' exonuclease n=1 Tax=Winogradskyella sp. A2 TaxID=3366944 RepID=UPI00398C4364
MKWLRRKSHPEFWVNYINHFKSLQTQELEKIRFVVFDTETTGLDTKNDRILSIGCIAIEDLKIKISDQLECYLNQDSFNAETVKIHGLLKEGKLSKIEEKEAVIEFLSYLKNAVLVAHHAAFDMAMINNALKRNGLPKLNNKVLDTGHLFIKTKLESGKDHYSLDELSERFNIPKHDRHTASGDAFITALLFLKLITYLKRENEIKLNDLMKSNNRIGLL